MVLCVYNIAVKLGYGFLLGLHDVLDVVLEFAGDQIVFSDFYLIGEKFLVLGADYLPDLWELSLQFLPETLSVLGAAVH